MGLDNGFILRKKGEKEGIYLFNFRNFYALANMFRREQMLPNIESPDEPSYEYAVTEEKLEAIHRMIEPIYLELIKLHPNKLGYYDEKGYPKKYNELFFGNEFDPTNSQSAFAGQKLVKLYQRINALLEIMDGLHINCPDDMEIIFYDSY